MSEWVNQVISELGYVGLAVLTLVETVFPPIPSEVILPLGGYLAAQGQLALLGVVVAGTAGSSVGALILFAVGKRVSREQLASWAEDHGGWLLLTGSDVEDAFDWFERHGKAAVFLARLVPGVRSLISIPAGVCGMGLGTFLLYTVLGTAIWSAALAYAGMMLGQQYREVGTVLQWATYAMVGLVLLAFLRWVVKRKARDRETEGEGLRAPD